MSLGKKVSKRWLEMLRFLRTIAGLSDPLVGTGNAGCRDAWVEHAVRALPAGSRLLDAGAGPQRYRRFCEKLHYVSQDFAAYDGTKSGEGLQSVDFDYGRLDLICDITKIPVPDNSFDAVLCTEVLEHLPSPDAALVEFGRLIRPGGTLILTAPFGSLSHMAPYFYATGFSRHWFETHLAQAGFEIIEITPNGNYFEFVAQEVWRLSQMSARYAGLRVSWLEKAAILVLLRLLQKCSRQDHESHSLACLGFHVRARKTA